MVRQQFLPLQEEFGTEQLAFMEGFHQSQGRFSDAANEVDANFYKATLGMEDVI
jgi:hypothetical protein